MIVEEIATLQFIGEKETYDLEVEEDHSYVAESLIVHNSSPNLLNIPNNPLVKEAFAAPEGYYFYSGDFSSQEVRENCNLTYDEPLKDLYTTKCEGCSYVQSDEQRKLIALDMFSELQPIVGEKSRKYVSAIRKRAGQHTAHLPELTILHDDVYQEAHPSACCPACGEFNWSEPDPHSLCAQQTYDACKGKTLTEIKKEFGSTYRQYAKVIRFQIQYGATGYGMANSLFESGDKEFVDKAQGIIDTYMEANPWLKNAMDDAVKLAAKQGYVETIGGYRRHFPELQEQSLPKHNKVHDNLPTDIAAMRCFGKFDVEWDPNKDGAGDKLAKGDCPRRDAEEGCIKCSQHKECAYEFKRRNLGRIKNRAGRQAFNALLQGGSAQRTMYGLRNLLEERDRRALTDPRYRKVKVMSQIYDAAYLLVEDTIPPKDIAEMMTTALEAPWKDDDYVKHQLEVEPPMTAWHQGH